MKTHRFFVTENIDRGGEITLLSKDTIHQIKDVLRLKKGDPVILLDNEGTEFHGELTLVSKDKVTVDEKEIKKSSRKNKIKVNLYFSMIKKDKAEWVLQKCTELGVSEFYPVISDRTEKSKLNMERAEKIVREAAEQSERPDLPMLHEIMSLEEALDKCETPQQGAGQAKKIVLHMDGEKIKVSQLVEQGEVSVFVGPEGGWSEKDMDIFKRHDVEIVSLGENVLRAETASVALASLFHAL